MSYGYIGDTSSSIKQQKKNAGVLSVSDVLDLESKGQLGGSLELLTSQTVTSMTSAIDFTEVFTDRYDVYYLESKNAYYPRKFKKRMEYKKNLGTKNSA